MEKIKEIKNTIRKPWLLVLVMVLLWSSFIRFWRLGHPDEYVFDEVYHAFTGKMFDLDRYEAWVWWESPPEGVAYEWTHPPLAKLFMGLGMEMFGGPGELPTKIADPEKIQSSDEKEAEKQSTKILGGSSFGWRFFGAVFGVLATFGLFLIGSSLFNNKWIGVLSAFIFTLDLLPLVQSRTAMNDIYAITFMIFAVYFFVQRKPIEGVKQRLLSSRLPWHYWILTGMMLGCAAASKWTSFFVFGILGFYQALTVLVTFHFQKKDDLLGGSILFLKMFASNFFKGLIFFLILPVAIYLLSYFQLYTVQIDDYKGNDLQTYLNEAPDRKISFENSLENPDLDEKTRVSYEEELARMEYEFPLFTKLSTWNEYMANRSWIWWGLQKQMWWYHTKLVAEHNYTSQWWTWPFMIRPVWYYILYCNPDTSSQDSWCAYYLEHWPASDPNNDPTKLFADIYTMGNPMIFWAILPVFIFLAVKFLRPYRWWFASILVFACVVGAQFAANFGGFTDSTLLSAQFVKVANEVFPPIILFASLIFVFLWFVRLFDQQHPMTKDTVALFILIIMFMGLWLPWSRSPRIMFFYHFLPPVTFFYPLLAYVLYTIGKKSESLKIYVIVYLMICLTSFVYFYPHVTAWLLPKFWREQYWWFKSWV